MKQQLLIPNKIKVGFQDRNDTYTKKLAYVIYYDDKGVLRKEKSWKSWRDNKIDPVEYENVPTEGFVLNKGVGGSRYSYGWNARNEYIRVYDPRDFEFEISVANLLFILSECNCYKGKGLEGKFVYSWDRTELVLLPAECEDYRNSKDYTKLQSQGIKAKDLILGASYITKKQEVLTYIGRFMYYENWKNYGTRKSGKRHIFWNGENFSTFTDLKSIAAIQSETVAPDYAELVEKFQNSENASKIVKLIAKPSDNKNGCVIPEGDGTFLGINYRNDDYRGDYLESSYRYSIEDDKICTRYMSSGVICKDPEKNKKYGWGGNKQLKWIEHTGLDLYGVFENGAEVQLIKGRY